MAGQALPFLLQPQREHREIGEAPHTLRIPLYGKIRLREALMIKEELFVGEFLRQSARLAEAIIESQSITEIGAGDLMAVRILTRLLGGSQPAEPMEMVAEQSHSELIADAVETLSRTYREQQVRAITAIIQLRLGVLEWTDERTVTLADEVQSAILQIVEDERSAMAPKATEEEVLAQLADSLGKYGAATTPATPAENPTTGETSTGAFASTGPTTPTPALTASQTSPQPRSSRRAPKAKSG